MRVAIIWRQPAGKPGAPGPKSSAPAPVRSERRFAIPLLAVALALALAVTLASALAPLPVFVLARWSFAAGAIDVTKFFHAQIAHVQLLWGSLCLEKSGMFTAMFGCDVSMPLTCIRFEIF
jgi:hypothetical protein